MIFTPLALAGAYTIAPEPSVDERGFFARTFCAEEFGSRGLVGEFPQHSLSFNAKRGTLRGLHYQEHPHQEAKLVCCRRGGIFDVIVDLRRASPTFGKWQGVELSAENRLALYVPEEFAHGFITLEDASEVHYMISRPHAPGRGRAIHWDDPDIGIVWPLRPAVMSDSDRKAPAFRTIH